MSYFTSLIPENAPIPDPPHLKYIGLVVSCILTFVFAFFCLFVVFEFSLDMIGIPLHFKQKYETVIKPDEEDDLIKKPEPETLQSMASRFKILSPFPNSCVSNGELTILCTWNPPQGSFHTLPFSTMDLRVDDRSFPWNEQFGNNTWFTHLKLKPGIHQLRSPVFEMDIFVEDSEHPAPPALKRFSMHPSINNPQDCATCHYMLDESDIIIRKGHNLAIGEWKGNESCLACHQNEQQYERTHLKIAAPETDCGACHAVHGTVNSDKLLKYPKEDFNP